MKGWHVILASLAMGLMSMPAAAATLAAHFDFNQGSGDPIDVTGNGHDTTIGGAVWVGEGGGFYHLSFDGASGPVTLPAFPNNFYAGATHLDTLMEPAGSIKAWYRADVFKGAIFSYNAGGTGPSLAIGVETAGAGNIAGALGNVGSASYLGGVGNVAAPLGEWTHVALTWDAAAGHARLYVNGALAGSEAALSFTPNFTYYPGAIGLAPYGSPNFYFDGDIDEVEFWSGELTAAEVLAEYEAGRATIPEPASLALLGLGLSLVTMGRRRRA